MLCHKLKREWLLVILFFIFVGKTLSHDDMCGDWNMDHASTPPEKQFQCENKISLQHVIPEGISVSIEQDEGSGDDSGLEEDWPWLGTLTSVDDPDEKSLGVVVAPDVVITDLTFKDVEVAKLRFTLKTGFEASVHALLVKRSPDLLVITLDTPISNDQLRPACVPPPGYISKFIKTNSCQQESSKIVKVNLEDGKSSEPIINEYTCGERIFQSETCTERMMSNSDNCLKPNEKFLKSPFNISPTKGSERKSEFYTCHKNVLKAREKCELDLLEYESRCKDTPDTACSIGLEKSDTKSQKNQCYPEINKMAECIVDQFGDSTFPFEGVNCLHDFITMPKCAKHAKKAGLKSLGKTWANNPCKKKKTERLENKCYNKKWNRYLKRKPYTNNWSVSMVKEVDKFGSCILEETRCTSCGEGGNDICTSGNQSPGSDMLFWFDSCRSKWFFLGPSTSTSLECDESLRMHPNVEKGTEYIRNSISSKVPEVELYPRPIIVVLGPTGVGKSTTANALISGTKNRQCFSTGGGIKSKTRRSSWRMGKWLGVGNCVTLVDTPGTDDTSGPHQDYENIKELMETLKYDLKNIDVFLVMFRENNLRFVESMRKALDLFVSIFGESFWDNVVTEFTFAGFSVAGIKERYKRICTACKEIKPSESLTNGDFDNGYSDDIPDNDSDSCSGDQADDDNRDGSNDGSGSGCDDEVDDGNNSQVDDGNSSQVEEYSIVVNGKCSSLYADAVKGSPFFKKGSLENEAWNTLERDPIYLSNQTSYRDSCGWSESEYVYDKADYATRKIKEMDWNAGYSSHFKVLENKKIPTVFIHPVFDRKDLRQCQVFKRETSKLQNLIRSMKPFQCSEKCKAPDGYFLGKPHIFSDPLIFAKQNRPFSIGGSVWNGVEITGLMEKDIFWFHGWKLMEIDLVIWSSRIFPKSYDSKSSDDTTEIELIFHRAYPRDAGLYSCVLPGVKDIGNLKFEESARLEKETIKQSIGGSINNANIICSLPITEAEYTTKQDLVQWYHAREIDSKRDSADFNINLVKQANQYAISKLTLKKANKDLEGIYACKSPGGFSNEVSLKIKIDASWAPWGEWSTCSKTCTGRQGHHGSKSRSRQCIPAENSEATCDQLDVKDGIDTSPCGTVCCPTDGKFLQWQSWGKCTKTCSNFGEIPGTKIRKRECTPPSLAPCPGQPCDVQKLTQYDHCNSHSEKPCPINGGYSLWSDWSECKADISADSCSGRTEKKRLCNNPTPQNGGLPCEGATNDIQIEKKFCNPTCPQDCECDSEWPKNWEPCSKTCGNCGESVCNEGTQNKRRSCRKETCILGQCGKTCFEVYGRTAEIDQKVCTIPHCPIDGNCTKWSGWSGCDRNTGTHFRTRTIIPPKFAGNAYTGSSKQVENCPVHCDCDGVDWGEMSSCNVTCGTGYKVARRGCRSSLNGGRKCTTDDEEKREVCKNKRCPVIIEGKWGTWSKLSNCSAACGGGHQQKTRSCDYEMIDDYDEDYDTKMPCSGSGVENTGENSCNNQKCAISNLIFLMDTSGSFSGTDRNSAFTLARGLLEGVDADGINVPKYQLVEVNDPTVNKRDAVTNRKTFEDQLFNLYKQSHGGGGDWAEQSFKALAKPYALDAAPHRAVVCLFTDAGTHELDKLDQIVTLRDEKDIQIFVFLTPDYDIYGSRFGGEEESYRAYQNISKKHTYIMSETHPDTILNLVKKYLKKVDEDCETLGGPPRWGDYPSECQFPFTYKGVEYTNCTSVDHNQPWCSTVTGAKKEYLEGKWGNCGDCSGKVNPLCRSYTTLSDPWRKVSDAGHSSKMDDSRLAREWYRFNVTGAGKIPTSPPTGSANGVGYDTCGTGGVAWMTGDLPSHEQDVVERKFCFESDKECNHFKRINVLWCTDGVNPEFYIYELKPTVKNFGYCVIE